MAQVCGGSNFDFEARARHDSALRILSRTADHWAFHGRASASLDYLIAVMLRVFLSRGFGWKSEAQALGFRLRVGTPQQEAEFWLPAAGASFIAELLQALHAQLGAAAEQWSLGNPEQPPTAHVLNAVEHVLFTHRLTRRPAHSKLPITICVGADDSPSD